MNIRRGLLRFCVVASLLWVVFVAVVLQTHKPAMVLWRIWSSTANVELKDCSDLVAESEWWLQDPRVDEHGDPLPPDIEPGAPGYEEAQALIECTKANTLVRVGRRLERTFRREFVRHGAVAVVPPLLGFGFYFVGAWIVRGFRR
jgi:hypothetical protein